MIPALVLTAGLATRLRPLSFVRAKAALPVAGEPLARRILRRLAAGGVTDAVLNLHHLPHTLTAVVGDGSDLGVRVRYSWEMPVLGSAGGPRRALSLLGSSTFLIVNGDTLTDVDVAAVALAHQRSGALVTMAVVPNTEPDKYGGVLVDADGAVTGFTRRSLVPSHHRTAVPSYHFIGVQVAEAEAFASLEDRRPAESVAALYPALIAAKAGSVRAHVCDAEFLDIGTPADYLRTSLLLARRESHSFRLKPEATDSGSVASGSSRKNPARIHPTARVDASILWDDVEVGAGAMLHECVVTDGVHVPADTSWTGVTIRTATSELAPGERRIDGLAICSL
ncbi:MAG: NDP-sugar synthase [Acidobacteria bacterium]|nr:NDP-sugar synthase [Acidobacteriota bacterium]